MITSNVENKLDNSKMSILQSIDLQQYFINISAKMACNFQCLWIFSQQTLEDWFFGTLCYWIVVEWQLGKDFSARLLHWNSAHLASAIYCAFGKLLANFATCVNFTNELSYLCGKAAKVVVLSYFKDIVLYLYRVAKKK